MANPTYVLINSYTVGAGNTSSVTFSSIPQTYTDLLVKVSAQGTYTSFIAFRLNPNGSTSNMTSKVLMGDGSSVSSFNDSIVYAQIPGAGTNTFSNYEVYIPNYTSSNYKSFSMDAVAEQNATLAYTPLTAALWSSTSVISSMTFAATVGNLVQYSTFYLYGINNS